MNPAVVAIDPGKTGALVVVQFAPLRLAFWRMPYLTGETECPFALYQSLSNVRANLSALGIVVVDVALERQTGQKDQGHQFALMHRYGKLEGALAAAFGRAPTIVSPRTWQSLLFPKKAKNTKKILTRQAFAQLFKTKVAVGDGIQDAALLGVAQAVRLGILDRPHLQFTFPTEEGVPSVEEGTEVEA